MLHIYLNVKSLKNTEHIGKGMEELEAPNSSGRNTKGNNHYRSQYVLMCSVTQSCPALCDPMDCSLPVSSVHGILQARILEWIAVPSPGNLPNPGIEPRSPALQADSLPAEPPGKPKDLTDICKNFLQDTDPHQMKTADCKHVGPTLVETRRLMMLEI